MNTASTKDIGWFDTAKNLITLAHAAGFSEQEIADSTGPNGVKQPTINRIRNEKIQNPRSDVVDQIVSGLMPRLMSGEIGDRLSLLYPKDDGTKKSALYWKLLDAMKETFRVQETIGNYAKVMSDRRIGAYTFLPRFNILAGLGDGEAVNSEQIVDSLAFRTEWLEENEIDPDHAACVKCIGDSMYPTIRHGDIVLINSIPSPNESLPDGVYAISRETGADLQ